MVDIKFIIVKVFPVSFFENAWDSSPVFKKVAFYFDRFMVRYFMSFGAFGGDGI
jgi:hypothetical protein